MLTGIDVASWQTGIPQSVINQADVIVVKATDGVGYVNPALVDQFTAGVTGGKKVGVYHYGQDGDPIAQADFFVNTVASNSLYPDFFVLDFEEKLLTGDVATSLPPQEDFALRFLARVKELTGTTPWFYCYMNKMVSFGYTGVRDAGYKLWLAGYPYGQQYGFGPQMSLDDYITWQGFDSTGWDFAGWQYSSQGRLDGWGGDLDFNIFFEDVVNNHTGVLPGQDAVPSDAPPASMEDAIAWMTALQGRVTYSMANRNGPNSYDCSSAVYHALIAAGIIGEGSRIGNTETMFNDLPEAGFTEVGIDADGSYHARRGDVFIWGDHGSSAGSAGHTGIFVDADNIVHCNYGYNGITINNHDQIWVANGSPSFHLFRYEPATVSAAGLTNTTEKETSMSVLTEKFKNYKTGGETDAATELGWLPQNFQTVFESIANIRKEVLNQKILKQGATQKQGEMTSLALEVSYLADNFARTHQALARIEARLNKIEGK